MSNFINFLRSDNRITRSLILNICYLTFKVIKHLLTRGPSLTGVNSLKKYKTSDTLVVLGAGCSVNELSKSQIEKINNFDVIGFGYTCILPINQTFMFYESPHITEHSLIEEHQSRVVPAVKNAFNEGKIRKLIWKNSENHGLTSKLDLSEFSKITCFNSLCSDPKVFLRLLTVYRRFGLSRFFLIQCRASLVAFCVFALSMGYTRVIFAGVDINTNPYFWLDTDKYGKDIFAHPYVALDGEPSLLHRTNDPKFGPPVSKILEELVAGLDSVSFFVTSENSALCEFIDIWPKLESE